MGGKLCNISADSAIPVLRYYEPGESGRVADRRLPVAVVPTPA